MPQWLGTQQKRTRVPLSLNDQSVEQEFGGKIDGNEEVIEVEDESEAVIITSDDGWQVQLGEDEEIEL